ncbi:hypothetical protein NPIL_481171 [Nephila pilipes]|uniref:Uncharacterized protein n=1 Tax=Nephila pilipes TaxID=299642 RepID=A0A8X6N2X2_NEPPI|nr:hypothetical protein NPIL_481171 [Nephila pilipes]
MIFPGTGKSRLRHPERARTSAKLSGNTPLPLISRNVPLEIRRTKFFPVLVFEKKKNTFRHFKGKSLFSSENGTGNRSSAFRRGRAAQATKKNSVAASTVSRCGSRERNRFFPESGKVVYDTLNALGLPRNFGENLPYPLSVGMSHSKFGEINFFPVLVFEKKKKKILFGKRVFSSKNGTGNGSSTFRRGRAAQAMEKSLVAASKVARCGSCEVRGRTKGTISTKLSENDVIQ